MDVDVPYMPSVKNLHVILDAMQKAAVPDAFGMDFLKDLGFTSSNDRPVIKLLKYLGFLDNAGRPQASSPLKKPPNPMPRAFDGPD